MMPFICGRCAVWRPVEEVTFTTAHDALMHAVDCHPHALVAAVETVMNGDVDAAIADRALDDSRRDKGGQ